MIFVVHKLEWAILRYALFDHFLEFNEKWQKWPRNDQEMTKKWPRNDQEMTKKWPRNNQEMTEK